MPNRQSNTLKVSVIIPTRNRRELLREVIESLCNQTLDPNGFEIIVMDNASTDGTPVLIKHLQARSPCTIRYGQLSSNLGPVQARNLGVKLAEAEIVAFTDSDCRAHPEWLERGLQVLTESDGSAFVAGAVLDKPDQAVSFFTIRNGAVPGENYTYPTCNVFYRKSVFLEMGGFDESVWLCDIANSPIECADTDLAWRIKEAGYETAYLDDLIIYHEVARATPRNWLLYHTRLLVIPELVRRHPQLRKKLLQWGLFFSADNALFYLAVIGLILAWTLDGGFFALVVPYVLWAGTVRNPQVSVSRIPRILGRVLLFGVRHVAVCGSLIYGSVRSRTIVL